MRTLKLSWPSFVFLSAAYITFLNFKLFIYLYSGLNEQENLIFFPLLIFIYFCLLSAIFSLLFLPYLSRFLLGIFILVTCFSSYFMVLYGTMIDKEMLRNVIHTDTKEVYSYLNFSFLVWILFFGILPCFLLFKVKIDYFNFKKHLIFKFSILFTALASVLLILFIFSKSLVPFFRTYKHAREYNAPFFQLYSAMKLAKEELLPKPSFKIIAADATLKKDDKKKLLVFVLGETARAENFSLGTYKNNLTNFASPKENVIYFTQVSSCGTSTAVSVPCMFSVSKRSEFSSSEYQENALDILQKVGVKVTWLDNNSGGCQGVCKRLKNVRIFSNEYDGFFIDELKNELENINSDSIIILHLQGSHGPTYYKRYPNEFKKFTPTCDTNELSECSKEQIYNTYDNTLAYTDYILKELIEELKLKKGYESALLYVSDHGESLGENGIYLHGMPYAIAPSTQTHIPMIFWSNDKALNSILSKKRNLVYSHDNIFSSLLGFFGVNTQVYDKNYDIFVKN